MNTEASKKIRKFYKTSWTNMNLRCGKYRHLGNKNKNKAYENIQVDISREEYKRFCYENVETILALSRPSIDRKDSNKNYTIDNIQIIELSCNIVKKRAGNEYLNGNKASCIRGVRESRSGKWTARITYNRVEKHLGSFSTKEGALEAFSNKYIEIYGKRPF